jgi:hypothetical protein
MKIRWNRNSEKGTTIVEVLMASGLLIMVGAGILGSFSYGFFAMQLARENQRATQIVLEKVETIRLYSWDQVNSNGFIPTTFTDVYDPQAPEGSRGVTYVGTVTITNFPSGVSYSPNLREFTVNLQWTNNHSLARSRTLSTWVAKDGLQNYVY